MRRGEFLSIAAFALSVAATGAGCAYAELDRTPIELIRHADRRLEGHAALHALLSRPLQWTRELAEPAAPTLPSPLSLRGAVAAGLPAQTYDERGLPREAGSGGVGEPTVRQLVGSMEELIAALENAQAGDVIEILPGRYELRRNVWLKRAGTPEAPVLVRAASLGKVRIELRSAEGFVVAAPYWVFENLHIVGTCVPAEHCEHAFHIVGTARATVLRNNVLQDFNNAIKVNGQGGNFPDHGLVQHNHVFNTEVRETDSPVVGIDVVGASGWRIADNLVADIAKASTDFPSYAAFMKGGGSDGRFERNVIICRLGVSGRKDIRVGLSLGGGGTAPPYRRPGAGVVEYGRGMVANNVVAFCNDAGIDLKRATGVSVAFNTLIATAGIELRDPPSDASIYGNAMDGRIRKRDGTLALAQYNSPRASDENLFGAADAGQESSAAARIPALTAIADDFCGNSRGNDMTRPGAFGSSSLCSLLQPTPLRLLAGEAAPNS